MRPVVAPSQVMPAQPCHACPARVVHAGHQGRDCSWTIRPTVSRSSRR